MHSSTLHKRNTFKLYFIVIFTTQPAACVSVYSCLVKYNFMFPPDTKLFVVPYFPSLYLPLNPLSLLLQMLLILSMHLIKLIMFILLHLLLHMLMQATCCTLLTLHLLLLLRAPHKHWKGSHWKCCCICCCCASCTCMLQSVYDSFCCCLLLLFPLFGFLLLLRLLLLSSYKLIWDMD